MRPLLPGRDFSQAFRPARAGAAPVSPGIPSAATLLRGCTAACLVALSAAPAGGATFTEWQHRQEIRVPAPGLVKLDLPPETLDASRPGLEDLRVLDPAGNEVPYVIERANPVAKAPHEVKTFRVSLGPAATVLTLETGLAQPLDGVAVMTPAPAFIKAVQVEGSTDGKRWQTLAQGVPIFRQPNGASQLHVAVPPKAWAFLRITVDDQRSPPVPFTGAQVHAAAPEPVPSEPLEVRIAERTEVPGETRLTLSLNAAHLHLAALRIESPDPLFTRKVTLAVRQIEEDAIRERMVAEGVIFRIAIPGRPPSSQLTLPLELVAPSRELLVRVQNDDSPPLQISALRGQRRPVYLVCMARQSGSHAILTGNRQATAPRYDLASLGVDFKAARSMPLLPSPLAPNPEFRPPEVLQDVPATGPVLDVSSWAYRKRTQLSGSGVQQVELDLEVLARAQPTFADLRVMSDGRQVPYILEYTSITRPLVPQVTPANDPRRVKVSRWMLKLPHRNLPLVRLVCTTRTPLFRREMELYEERADERGNTHHFQLGRASWSRTPERVSNEFVMAIGGRAATDTLFLETNNVDNPPIELEGAQLSYPVWRIHFKAAPGALLYYGNRRAELPRYDLTLVSRQVLTAERSIASLRAEEPIGNAGPPGWVPLTGRPSLLFWLTLTVVVVVLLLIISRLLPKSPPAGRSSG